MRGYVFVDIVAFGFRLSTIGAPRRVMTGDWLAGSGGNDLLDGGPGADFVNGGKGADFCVKGERRVSCP
jgi:Ca2+-binding RTX toxin-like protein